MRNGRYGVPVATSMPWNPGTPNGFVANGALFSGPSLMDSSAAKNTVTTTVATPTARQRGERNRPFGKRSGTKIPTSATMNAQIQELTQPRYTAPGREPGRAT